MPYAAPTVAAFRPVLLRDLRDPSGLVFNVNTILDSINEGLSELNSVRPPEHTLTQSWGSALTSLPFNYVFMVEYRVDPGNSQTPPWRTVTPSLDDTPFGRNGWSYFGKALNLSDPFERMLQHAADAYGDTNVSLRVSGYRDRELASGDSDVVDLIDAVDQMAVRKFVRAMGFRALSHDRAIFQQWQAQANNTDVSPTQLQGFVSMFMEEWVGTRRRLTTIRRPAVG